MKRVEFIPLLLDRQQLEAFYESQGIDKNSEALHVYVRGRRLNLNSEVTVLPVEDTSDVQIISRDGEEYIQLDEVSYLSDLIEHDLDLKDKGYSNRKVGRRLLRYLKNDA